MKLLDADTRDLLWFDPDVPRGPLARTGDGADGPGAAAASGRPRRCQLFLGPPQHGARMRRQRDRLSCHQRHQESAAGLAAGAVHGAARRASMPGTPTGRIGLLHVAFPLKMLLQPDGHLTSCDLLHTVAGGDYLRRLREPGRPARCRCKFPSASCGRFRGRPMARSGLRERTGFAADEPAFGTILKPTAGITPDEVGKLVAEAAECPLLLFVKEDEDLYPNLDYSPVAERVRQGGRGDRAVEGAAGGQGTDLRPAHHRRPARDARDPARGARGGGDGRDVQRDVCRRHGADGPRGDQAPAAARRPFTATTPASA